MRKPLPNRRQSITVESEWANRPLTVSVGMNDEGAIREVFADHAKVGSDGDAMLDDCLVVLSLALQKGWTISEFKSHIGREGTDQMAPAASVLGYVIELSAELEA